MNILNYNTFKEEMEQRISNVKKCQVPDFGLKYQNNLFEFMMSSNQSFVKGLGEDNHHFAKRPSLWMLFLDAIQRFPKFQRLKDIIDAAKAERNSIEQQEKRDALEKFLKQKMQNEDKVKLAESILRQNKKQKKAAGRLDMGRMNEMNRSVGQQSPLKKDGGHSSVTFQVEEILRDKEQLKSIQKMMEENQRMQGSSSNLNLQRSKEIMRNIFQMQHTCQLEHDALKKAMKYKFPKEKLRLKLEKWKEQIEMGATVESKEMEVVQREMDMLINYSEARPKVDAKWVKNPFDKARGIKKDFVQLNIRNFPKRKRPNFNPYMSKDKDLARPTLETTLSPLVDQRMPNLDLKVSTTARCNTTNPSFRQHAQGQSRNKQSVNRSPSGTQQQTSIDAQWKKDTELLSDNMFKHISAALSSIMNELMRDSTYLFSLQKKQLSRLEEAGEVLGTKASISPDDVQTRSFEAPLLNDSMESGVQPSNLENSILLSSSRQEFSSMQKLQQFRGKQKRRYVQYLIMLNQVRRGVVSNLMTCLENGEKGDSVLKELEQVPICFRDDQKYRDLT